jgi:uncharacterized protein with HEPN domain
MPKDDAILLDLLQASLRAVEGLGALALDEFVEDWRAQSIVLHQLLMLGEGVKRLSAEFRDAHAEIPWRKMAGLRDILIHCYDTVDLETVLEIVHRDLPPFIIFLETVAPSSTE